MCIAHSLLLSSSRYRQLKEQHEGHCHEAELVRARMEQSSHHQQLTHLQHLRDTIGQSNWHSVSGATSWFNPS